jgi:hypothetical protein
MQISPENFSPRRNALEILNPWSVGASASCTLVERAHSRTAEHTHPPPATLYANSQFLCLSIWNRGLSEQKLGEQWTGVILLQPARFRWSDHVFPVNSIDTSSPRKCHINLGRGQLPTVSWSWNCPANSSILLAYHNNRISPSNTLDH